MSRDLILASNSPRRKDLLHLAGLKFEIRASNIEEINNPNLSPHDQAMDIAKQKAEAVPMQKEELIIGADTIVALGNKVFGKPKDREDAIAILNALSGKEHEVITGICLRTEEQSHSFYESSTVSFSELDIEDIVYYVDNHSPYDKAGAYAIQEWIGVYGIEKIQGCYYNIVGLPVNRLLRELKHLKYV